MDILQFLQENFYAVAVVLWILGAFMKSTPKIPDWTVPYVLTIVSCAFGISMFGLCANAFIQGVIAAGVAVLGANFIKQGAEGFKNLMK